MLPRIFSMNLALALTLALPLAGKAAVDPVQAYKITPSSVSAGKASNVTLYGGSGWSCATAFSRESVVVSEKRVDLSFVVSTYAIANTSVIRPCMYEDQIDPGFGMPIYGPTFSLPSLKAGQYEVWGTQIPECAFANPSVCKFALNPQYAGVLTVSPEGTVTYSISPTSIAPGKDFTLDLLSYQFNCGTTYDMLASSVNGNAISLTFLDHEGKTGTICPDIYRPYGPAYKMAALKAGTYTVTAYRLPACAAQGCKMAAIPAEAGTLVVKDAAKTGWFLKDDRVVPDKAFTLQVLNNAYGNCQTSFSHLTLTMPDMVNGAIDIRFLVETDAKRVCVADIRPYGPSFEMKPLKPGAYPVYVTEYIPCEVDTPRCIVDRFAYIPSDTLFVTTSAAILRHGSAAARPYASFQGRRLTLAVSALAHSATAETGAWKAELMNVSGQVLESRRLDVNESSAPSLGFDVGTRAARGLYMVRLRSPSGETHTLRVVRKD